MSALLGLDIGARRVGVALVSAEARLPWALITLEFDDKLATKLKRIIDKEGVSALVVGWPRGLDGQRTAQTKDIEAVAESLKAQLKLPVYLQDEAATSLAAKDELEARGKPYTKAEVDSLAAVYILDDFLKTNPDKV